jgi:hypothetical protein
VTGLSFSHAKGWLSLIDEAMTLGAPSVSLIDEAMTLGAPSVSLIDEAMTLGGPSVSLIDEAMTLGGPSVSLSDEAMTLGGPPVSLIDEASRLVRGGQSLGRQPKRSAVELGKSAHRGHRWAAPPEHSSHRLESLSTQPKNLTPGPLFASGEGNCGSAGSARL